MTWEEMCEKEPRLKQLENDCKAYCKKNRKDKEREEAWYRVFKKRMQLMVGFMAQNIELGSTECYDLAYRHLIDILEV